MLALEILLWLNGAVLLLVVVVALALQVPAVQTFLAQKATVFLASRFNTTVKIGRFTTDWRNSIVLKEIYIADQQQDTLLFAGRLGMDLNIMSVGANNLTLRSVKIENGVLKISNNPTDSTYNFSFLANAFKPGKTDAQGEKFSLKMHYLQLRNIRFQVTDSLKKQYFSGTIGKFSMRAQNFDTKTDRYELGTLKLENSSVYGQKKREIQKAHQQKTPDFTFKKLVLSNLQADLGDLPAAQRLKLKIGMAELQADKIDLQDARADLSKFLLQNSEFRFYKLRNKSVETAGKPGEKVPQKVNPEKQLWKIWLKEVNWQNNHFAYNDLNKPLRRQGVDFNHWALQKFGLELANVYYSQGRISGGLEKMQFQEKSGFKLQGMKGAFKAGSDFLTFSNFELKTNQSLLREEIGLTWQPASGKSESRMYFVVKLKNASLAPQDLLFITPDLAQKAVFRKLGKNKLRANGKISGGAGKLQFHNFYLQGWSGTQVFLNGQISEILDPSRRISNLKITNLQTNRADLNTILGNGKTAPKVGFPARLSLNGTIQNQPGKTVFRQINLKASNRTSLQTSGTLTTRNGQSYLDLEMKNLVTSRTALLAMLPAGTISPEILLPDKVQFSGGFSGSSINHFALNGNFTTTFGNAFANVKIEPVQQFSGHIRLQNFNLGKVLKQEKMLGKATGKADFKGKGFKVQTMQLHYDAHVTKIEYQQETFHNIKLEGNLNQKIYQLNGNLANAALQGLGHTLKKLKPKNLNLKKADPTRIIPKKIEPKKLVPKFLRKKKKPEPETAP